MKSITKFFKKLSGGFNEQLLTEEPMTSSEVAVWRLFARLKLENKFTRQYMFRYFIVDFYSEKLKTAIDIYSKPEEKNNRYNIIKQQVLKEEGIKYIVLQKEDLSVDTEKLVELLKQQIFSR